MQIRHVGVEVDYNSTHSLPQQ